MTELTMTYARTLAAEVQQSPDGQLGRTAPGPSSSDMLSFPESSSPDADGVMSGTHDRVAGKHGLVT